MIILSGIFLFGACAPTSGAPAISSSYPNSRITCVGDHLFTHEQQKTDSFIIDRTSDPKNYRFAGAIYDGIEIRGDVIATYKKSSKGPDLFLVMFTQATFFGKPVKEFFVSYDGNSGMLMSEVTYYKDGKEVTEGTYLGQCADTTGL